MNNTFMLVCHMMFQLCTLCHLVITFITLILSYLMLFQFAYLYLPIIAFITWILTSYPMLFQLCYICCLVITFNTRISLFLCSLCPFLICQFVFPNNHIDDKYMLSHAVLFMLPGDHIDHKNALHPHACLPYALY